MWGTLRVMIELLSDSAGAPSHISSELIEVVRHQSLFSSHISRTTVIYTSLIPVCSGAVMLYSQVFLCFEIILGRIEVP